MRCNLLQSLGVLQMILITDGDTSTLVLSVHNTLMNVISRPRVSESEEAVVMNVIQGSESGHNKMIRVLCNRPQI